MRDHEQRPELLLGLDVVPKPVPDCSKYDEVSAQYRGWDIIVALLLEGLRFKVGLTDPSMGLRVRSLGRKHE